MESVKRPVMLGVRLVSPTSAGTSTTASPTTSAVQNNHVEGFHRGQATTLAADNPTIWKSLEWLRKDIQMRNHRLDELEAGGRPTTQKKTWKERDERLHRMAARYDAQWLDEPAQHEESPLIRYLRGFAHNFPERDPDWPVDVDNRINYAINVGKDRGFIHSKDFLIAVTGWRQGAGFTNTLRIIMAP